MIKKSVFLVTTHVEALKSLRPGLEERWNLFVFQKIEDAISLFQQTHQHVKCILLDAQLVHMDLSDVICRFHQVSYVPEFIVFSMTQLESKAYRDILATGVFDCLFPPHSQEAWILAIEKAMTHGNTLHRFSTMFDTLYAESAQKRMELAQEIATKKRAKGLALTADELLAFFPVQSPHQSIRVEVDLMSNQDPNKTLDQATTPLVLVVDDEPEIRLLLNEFLTRQGYCVLEAEDGHSALEIGKSHPEIDVVLLDIGLTDMSGFVLLDLLKTPLPATEYIILTGYDDIDFIREGFQHHVFDYLTKPFHHVTLSHTLSKALQRRYFHQVFERYSQEVLDTALPIKSRLSLLQDISLQRFEEGKSLIMADVYAFFPELKSSGIPETKKIPRKQVENNLFLFIESLKPGNPKGR